MSLFSKKSFDSSKCVSLLEVTQKRISILRKKRFIIAKQSRDDVARLLERGQDANAAARAEHVFREENVVGAYELLEQHCQLVIKGISAIKSQKECSSELKEAIASLIYAAPRCGDLQELQKVRDFFISRYGADYVTAILELRPGCAVNTQIIEKLSPSPPNSDVRLNLLKGIALEHKIDWNYQRAVAASFKDREPSEKAKVSLSASQASKRGLTEPAAKPKEPAASLAAQSAIPVKASVDKSEFVKTRQSSDVSGDPTEKDGHKGQASSARHNSAPSMVHDVSHRERDVIGASKSSSIGSPTRVDESKHHDRSKGNVSLLNHNSAPPAMHRAEPRKEDFIVTKQVAASVKQTPSSFFMHRDDERKGHPSSGANKASSFPTTRTPYEDRLARPGEHTSPNVEYSAESALHPTHGNRALPSKAKMVPIHLSADANVSKSPGVLGGSMQQAASSTPAFDQAKVSSFKPEPLSNGESLAARQYVRAHETYVKVDTAKTVEDLRAKDLSQIRFQTKQGASSPQADPPPYNTVDAHVESLAVKHYKDYKNVHQKDQHQNSSSKAMNREEVRTFNEDHAKGQLRGAHQEIHERSRGREGVDRIPSNRHQLEENLSEYQKYSTIAGRSTPRPSVPSELTSMKAEVDQELADLETAIASAARAADAAINMVRTCSMRSRADKKGVERERDSQTRKSYGGLNSETGCDARKAYQNTFIEKGDLDHKQPNLQEQEPVSLDAEMPHFDDYSSDESEEPPLYSKGRPPLRNQHAHVDLGKPSNMSAKSSATPFSAWARHDLSRESLHVSAKRNLQSEMLPDDDCAESVDSFSPKSSSSSYQHSSSDFYEEPDNARGRSRALPFRSNVYTADEKFSRGRHGIGNGKELEMKLASENADKGVLKWQGSAAMPTTGDGGKKGNVQPFFQPNNQHDAMTTQRGAGKFQGVSRRSVRSLGST